MINESSETLTCPNETEEYDNSRDMAQKKYNTVFEILHADWIYHRLNEGR